ncbi:hypothetical protein GIB67_001190 [Kingdonia uniflora]|uniref:RNase H type-1 domain-containing protein n=1 Tax=Kingdonia uniflora TaxID=39325 RepID=A0A7J7LGE4_9MAGN|nr:hypothetical protein GIB67_001190 [Kingdonia uniflora]
MAVWGIEVLGAPLYTLRTRLKRFKAALKKWNYEVFNPNEKKVAHIQNSLLALQKALKEHPDSSVIAAGNGFKFGQSRYGCIGVAFRDHGGIALGVLVDNIRLLPFLFGQSRYGGIGIAFRDHGGIALGVLVNNIRVTTSLFAECVCTMAASEMALGNGWQKVCLVSDSIAVVFTFEGIRFLGNFTQDGIVQTPSNHLNGTSWREFNFSAD